MTGRGRAAALLRDLLAERSVQLAIGGWLVLNVVVAAVAGDVLPFDWQRGNLKPVERLAESNVALVEVFALMALVFWLTRHRRPVNLAERAPHRSLAARETVQLVGYGAAAMGVGYLLAKAFGWHPFGLHIAGTLFGTHTHVERTEVIVWALYNLIVYAVIPLVWFRRRYSTEQLNLRSADRRGDTKVIVVVLAVESLFQIAVLDPEIFDLTGKQLILGAPLTFVLFLAGAVLPAMVFIYAILVPRFLRLTGSTATTVILGGLTYMALHGWDAWTDFDSAGNAVLSVAFLVFTYFGPGMIKTVLTVRTGNAWVHVWAYHAGVPHTLNDTPLIVDVFRVH